MSLRRMTEGISAAGLWWRQHVAHLEIAANAAFPGIARVGSAKVHGKGATEGFFDVADFAQVQVND